ncbi:hypothetical protein HHL17_32595 [Chitinophaga sp. G-6-1-13]|uniref:Uncharacterized protein n=1 Tax=Chitinophaga fulva TaxID=2728842 RepID=A0A848GYV9_9BACT|nr:hypothetical protein [Chitinophaga fulva]NML41970.1 hypothetical protein [Chitinophaga fulva]
MNENQPLSADTGKLQRYAAIAAFLDERLDNMLRRGELTTLSLDKLTVAPLTDAAQWYPQAAEQLSLICDTPATDRLEDGLFHLPVEEAHSSLFRFPLPATVPPFYPPAVHNRPSVPPTPDQVPRWLSLVCEQLLPLHAIVPLAQKIKQSAVIWYIRGNKTGIQICMSTFPQAIHFRFNKTRQHAYCRNRIVNLPILRNIVLHIRIIFRILKLHPDDGKDGDVDNIPVIRNNYH